MSGQPTKSPVDASKFRQQYLANLSLQANINDKNLQANKIYIKTGQTPTQLTDTRTLTERAADLVNLRIQVRSELSQITDGQNANEIADKLDPDQLNFVAQQINEIIKIIKPQYKLGIPADVFMGWLDRYMASANQNAGVSMGLQQGTGQQIIAGLQQISQVVNPNQIDDLLDQLKEENGLMTERLIRAIRTNAEYLKQIVPSQDFMTAVSQIQDLRTQAVVQEYTGHIIEGLPSSNDLNRLLRQLQTATLNKNIQRINEIGDDILLLITQSPEVKEQMKMIYNLLDREVGGVNNPFQEQPGTKQASPRTPREQEAALTAEKKVRQQDINKIRRIQAKYPQIDSNERVREFINEIASSLGTTPTKLGLPRRNSKDDTDEKYREALSNTNRKIDEILGTTKQAGGAEGRGMKGRGLVRSKKIIIEKDKGITPANTYSQLGKFFINNRKLNQNIISIRRGNGFSSKIPVKRVSNNLGDVIRLIVGGGVPNFSNLDKLNEEEKKYLYKITKESNIIDKLTIPTPNKEEEDKCINQFEIMKGEILSGNDNVEYIKKFKLLIVKLINRDLLPKSEGKEILIELASLGY